MKNIYFFLVAILVSSLGFGQGTETFQNICTSSCTPSQSSYGSRSWTGDDGSTWTATNSRTSESVDGEAMTMNDDVANTYIQSGTISGGVGDITITTQRKFSGGSGNLDVLINGSSVGTVPYGTSVQTTTISGVNISGNIVIQIDNNIGGSNSGGADRVAVDNINWTAFGGGSSPSVSFDAASSSENETDMTFNTSIPVTMTNYDMPVTVSVSVDGASTAEVGDYTLNTTSLSFTTNETLNVSLDINDDAGFEDESLILNIAVTSGTADLDTSQHTVTIVDDEVAPALTTIALQDFDGTSPSWSYTTSPEENIAACISGNDVWNVVSSLGSITVPNSTGDFFGGRDLNGTTDCGTSDVGTIDFSSINVSDFSSSVLSFDYEVDGFNSSTDELSYIVYFDASPEAEVFLCDGCNQQNLEGTVMVNIPNGTETVSLQVRAQFDGGSDYFGVDNFKVAGIYNGLIYSGGAWSPMDPDGSTGASDAIVIDGTVTFAADASLNDVSVLPGAAIRVNSSVTLGTNTLNLKSTSTSYSNLIVDGTVTGTVSYSRYVNSNDPINGNDLISAPLSGQDFDVFFGNNPNILSNPSGSEVLFGGFDNDDALNPFELWDETDTTPLAAGQGYRTGIDTAASSNFVSFEGTVNSSDVSVPIDQGTASILNLVGNPFPSYVDAQAFLTENASLLEPTAQVIYGYNDSTNGTSSNDYTIISSLENTTLDIAPGQAFFVASNASVGNILEFTTSAPDMRITSDQDDFIANRNARPSTTNINISLTNASEDFITKIYFTPSSGLGLDPGYDASLIGGVAPAFALFSHLVEQNMNVPFATQAIGKNDYNDTTVALGVNANMGEQLTFSIAQSTLPAEIEVYLDDTTANTSTLLTASDYIITPNANLNGTGRFYVRFSNSALSIPENNLDNITIYTNATNRTINISGQLEEGTIARVYDIQGRLAQTDVLSSNARLHSIDGNALHAGVYIVELSHDNLKKSKKVILR